MNNASNQGHPPQNMPIVDGAGKVTLQWQVTFARWRQALFSQYESGPTASRPTKQVWVGRRYFDTDLGKPVWVASVNPTVWRDHAGSVA